MGADIYLKTIKPPTLAATAFDPDGYIYSQQWMKSIGSFGDIIETPGQLNTILSNLTGILYLSNPGHG
jgi:hypothetical protein